MKYEIEFPKHLQWNKKDDEKVDYIFQRFFRGLFWFVPNKFYKRFRK